MYVSSIVDFLSHRANKTPDHISYNFLAAGEESESLTFRELAVRVRAIAARLQQLNARGERALLLFPAGIEYICSFYGCLASGTVAIPAYPPRMNRNLERLDAILKDAEPSFVLTTPAVFQQLQSKFKESPYLAKRTWILSSQIPLTEGDGWIDPKLDRDSVAFLQYTSASTSKPKGVIVSHGNILHNQLLMKEAVQHTSETIAVSWLPLFHDMGLVSVVLASLYNGMSCHLLSPAEFLKKPRLWLEAITRYSGTFSGAPDFAYQLCVDRISLEQRQGLDLSSWRVAYNGSEPIRANTLQRFSKEFAPFGFRQESFFSCYGLAEHTLFVTGGFYNGGTSFSKQSLEMHCPRKANGDGAVQLVSCGTPLLDTRVRIVDPKTDKPCQSGQIGEIWLSSPSAAHGYWNNDEASKRDFGARLSGDNGSFLRTGDLGFIQEGELFITGRLKDLIIIRGRNLAPQDIEQTVERCDPAVQPSCVAAISVEAGGAERLVVIAEVRREIWRSVDSQALIARIRSSVADEHAVAVAAVALLRPGSLPKTSSGKTQRQRVRQEFFAQELMIIDDWRSQVFVEHSREPRLAKRWTTASIENWIVDRLAFHLKTPVDRMKCDVPVSAFGLDSLIASALINEIEETFGIEWDAERLFTGEPTVTRLAERLARESSAHSTPPAPRALQAIAPPAPKVVKPNGNGRNGPSLNSSRPRISAKAQSFPSTARSNRDSNSRQHPFRSHLNPELGRLLEQMAMDKSFVRGQGSWLWDEHGNRYLDFLAQYGALPFGFNPSRIWSALIDVRDSCEPSFVQPSYLNAAGELARRLIAVAPPGMAYATFANSGAEVVEAAIKLCRSTTKRTNILAATNGFHGKTLGALSATNKEKYQTPFGAPVAGFHYVPYGDIEALRRALASRRYAGFIVEPLQAEGGIVEPPAGYLRMARKACLETGTLFIADEIQTGIGRTGAMFVCCELGITPDVLLVAKALGGGLIPIGACLCTAAAYNADFSLKHTSTFAGNTLACRAGLATLDLLQEDNEALLKHVASTGSRLKEGMLELKRRFPHLIAEARGRGFLLGLRFGLNRNSVDQGLLGYLGELEEFTFLIVGYLLNFEGVRVGCTLNQGGVLRIEPPLTATWEECEYFLRALERVLLLLEKGDVAALTAQVSGVLLPATTDSDREPCRIVKRRPLEVQPTDGRFAFLVHPLTWKDYPKLEPSLAVLSETELETLSSSLADNFKPFVIGETRVVAKNGKSAYGEFILVPRHAEQLKAMPSQEAVGEIREGIAVAQQRGAKIVGLGAYTSVVTEGGLYLKGDGVPALTTGNSYTAVAARELVRRAAAERNWTLSLRTVAVVGAGGAIGRALSVLLATEVGRLILVGNPEHPQESRRNLLYVTGRIASSSGTEFSRSDKAAPGSVRNWVVERGLIQPSTTDRESLIRLGEELISRTGVVVVSTDVDAVLPQADIVVCCTSSTEQFVRGDNLSAGVIVCDMSRPSNVSPDLAGSRPDVMVLNGGVVRLPQESPLGFSTFLPPGHAYACMAETIMMAMDHRYHDASLGFDLSLPWISELEQLGRELDFEVVLDRQEPNNENEALDVSSRIVLPQETFLLSTG
jgi:acetylornithine/succinyldiaminopimelate/putrescine aminotransferase/acyl-CoA synthetase (AMP-forming)/AMP-acid ligase II/predicted amino acid dehydrogenase/acyl carrier protein